MGEAHAGLPLSQLKKELTAVLLLIEREGESESRRPSAIRSNRENTQSLILDCHRLPIDKPDGG